MPDRRRKPPGQHRDEIYYRLKMEGCETSEIADRFGVTIKTVNNGIVRHRKVLREKVAPP